MIKLSIADTNKNAPPKIELIPETFDELYERVDEINKAEYPRRCVSYYLPLDSDKFAILLYNGLGFLMERFYFVRTPFNKSCGELYIDETKTGKEMSIKRLYYIAKGFLEGERFE